MIELSSINMDLVVDLFGITDEETSETTVDCNALLYHFCFNDQSHLGLEKVIAIRQNVNIIQDGTICGMADLDALSVRGLCDVDIGHDINVLYKEDLNVQHLKDNKEIVDSFNFINFEQALSA